MGDLVEFKPRFEGYTGTEFKHIIEHIFKENAAPDNAKLDKLLEYFVNLTSHPDGADLIYHTINDEDCTPESITKVV